MDNFYYYREDITKPLFGPVSYQVALTSARWLSMDSEHSGLAQICTYVGTRPNDPPIDPPILKVVHMFIRGKLTLSGNTAQYAADKQLPPIGPWSPRRIRDDPY